MNKTNIEYGDCSWNFYPGCLHKPQGICKVERCWAEGMSKRQRQDFHKPHLIIERLLEPLSRRKPAKILVNFMGDLFGDWIDPEQKVHSVMPLGKASITMSLKGWIFTTIKQCPQHTFLFLTKRPQNLQQWSLFPDNCFVGETLTGKEADFYKRIEYLQNIEAKVKYISFEPLLSTTGYPERLPSRFLFDGISWVIIGSQTKPYNPPKIEWVKEIVDACDKAGIPVFLKDNLTPLLRQNNHNLYSFPEWAGTQFAITGNRSLSLVPHPNEAMRKLRQEMPR